LFSKAVENELGDRGIHAFWPGSLKLSDRVPSLCFNRTLGHRQIERAQLRAEENENTAAECRGYIDGASVTLRV